MSPRINECINNRDDLVRVKLYTIFIKYPEVNRFGLVN